MNEPIFALDQSDGQTSRAFADPLTALGTIRKAPPSRRPFRARLLAGVFGVGTAVSRRLFSARA